MTAIARANVIAAIRSVLPKCIVSLLKFWDALRDELPHGRHLISKRVWPPLWFHTFPKSTGLSLGEENGRAARKG